MALPLLRAGKEVHATGLSTAAPGAYAEQTLVEESLTMAVPNGLPPQVATLTEPMAVAWHAVRRGEVKKRTVAVVIGCGPIGLAVICMLKAHGVRTVIASDLSARRRALAGMCGADIVVDRRHRVAVRVRRAARTPDHAARRAGHRSERDGETAAAAAALAVRRTHHTTLAANLTLELAALDLRIAANAVGEIVGKTTTEDLLDSIFSQFCIGK